MLKRHLHLCRHLGDGLAWRLLAPHTIRQLAKNDASKIFLSNQLSATNELLKIGRLGRKRIESLRDNC
jgi:hypothetical protein